MRLHSLALVALLGLTLTACDSNDEFEIGGTYSGTSQDGPDDFNDVDLTIPNTVSGDTFTFTLGLSENDGNGTVFSESSVTGRGTYDDPEITLAVEGETVEGTVSDDGDRITINDDTGLGAIVLTRD